jgi:hypothetical protein
VRLGPFRDRAGYFKMGIEIVCACVYPRIASLCWQIILRFFRNSSKGIFRKITNIQSFKVGDSLGFNFIGFNFHFLSHDPGCTGGCSECGYETSVYS